MARRRVPSFDDRLRRTPRIRSVTIQGSTITVEFKDRMDTRRSGSVFRTFTTAGGVVEYVGASWVDEFKFTSNAASLPGAYTGPSYARYMSGNLRNKSRFELLNGTRCDRILVQEDEVVTDDGLVIDPGAWKNNGEDLKIIGSTGGTLGVTQAHNNMQPSQVCTFIIKT